MNETIVETRKSLVNSVMPQRVAEGDSVTSNERANSNERDSGDSERAHLAYTMKERCTASLGATDHEHRRHHPLMSAQ